MSQTVVLGASPAGLSAAYELVSNGCDTTLLEPTGEVGGLARTVQHNGYCIDLGGGGLSTQLDGVWLLWQKLLKDEAVSVAVRSCIHYNHRLYNYPLSVTNALKHLGPIDVTLTGLSYIKAWLGSQQTQTVEAATAKDWLVDRFGSHLSRLFFEPYLEKVWGMGCDRLAPICAEHATRDMSLARAAIAAITPDLSSASSSRADASSTTQAIVDYPSFGAGSVWKNCQTLIAELGATVALNTEIVRVEHANYRVTNVVAKRGDQTFSYPVSQVVSSLPVSELVTLLDAPTAVMNAAHQLRHRHLIVVAVVVDAAALFPEQWIYVHQPDVHVSRIQNFKNWSAAMVPDADKTCLGMAYFCDEGDALWTMDSSKLVQLARQELVELGLVLDPGQIESGTALRQEHAYPQQYSDTFQHLAVVQDYLDSFENLQSIGRNGLHRYADLEDCMMSGLVAAQKVLKKVQVDPSQVRVSV